MTYLRRCGFGIEQSHAEEKSSKKSPNRRAAMDTVENWNLKPFLLSVARDYAFLHILTQSAFLESGQENYPDFSSQPTEV